MPIYPQAERDARVREYLPPTRLVLAQNVQHPEHLLTSVPVLQSSLAISQSEQAILAPGGALLLDFGKELHGGVRLVTARTVGRIRLRFGESVSEAMGNPNQDHSIHDETLLLPKLGALEYGCTGFRFVRVDNIGDNELILIGVTAVALYRDLPRVGSFRCNDERINRIWETAAYTVQLCMQDYLYDGIKRDRLVWLGDMHPESRVILSLFDDCSILPKSMDLVQMATPLPKYMNTMLTYSCWWIINQHEYFLHKGDLTYLKTKHNYLNELTRHFAAMVDEDGCLHPNGHPLFLDWPTSVDKQSEEAGAQGLFLWMFQAAADLAKALEDSPLTELATAAAQRLRRHIPECGSCKSAAALQTITGLADRHNALLTHPTEGVSTFYGYYMLLAQPVPSALEVIRKYWGAMLDFGATTFWEDFNLDWTRNAGPIDQIPDPRLDDLHADFGAFCYKGLRHSLCHGWSGGPAAYLPEKVLGIRVTAPGSRAISFQPNLGDLEYAEGSFPTPQGPIHVRLEKGLEPDIALPPGVQIQSHGLPCA